MRLLNAKKSFRRWLIVSLIISTTYLVLIGGMPSLAPMTPHDDTLFQKLAFKIANGVWLGRVYNSEVLAKGAFHSIQISLAYSLGIPIGFWFHCLYLLSAWFFCAFALPAASVWLRSFSYIALLFDPWQFTSFGIRLLREETYIPFMILAITFFIIAVDRVKKRIQGLQNASHQDVFIAFLLLISGLLFGLLLITREARIFIYLLMMIALCLFAMKYIYVFGLNQRAIGKSLSFIFAFLLLLPLPQILVSSQNQSAYGLFISNEFEDGQFKKFYQDLISVKLVAQKDKPWVPIQIQTLIKLKEHTSGQTLSSVLSDLNPGWKQFGCEQHSEACGEYGGGWLMWALRDAMFMQPSVKDPQTFQALAQQLRNELKSICSSNLKEYECSPSAFGYLPHPMRWGHGGSNNALLANELMTKFKGALLPSLISYPPAFFDEAATQSKWASRIGVYTAQSAKEQLLWNKRVRILFGASEAVRLALVTIWSFFLLLNWRGLWKIVEDPVIAFLAFALLLQILILCLIELTSFHAGGYLILASPILTIALCRMITTLRAPYSESL